MKLDQKNLWKQNSEENLFAADEIRKLQKTKKTTKLQLNKIEKVSREFPFDIIYQKILFFFHLRSFIDVR